MADRKYGGGAAGSSAAAGAAVPAEVKRVPPPLPPLPRPKTLTAAIEQTTRWCLPHARHAPRLIEDYARDPQPGTAQSLTAQTRRPLTCLRALLVRSGSSSEIGQCADMGSGPVS
jgi:hypothetical protein